MSNIKVSTFKGTESIGIALDMRLYIVVGLMPESDDESYVYVNDLRYSGIRNENRVSRHELASTIEELIKDLGYQVSDELDGSMMNITKHCMKHIQNISLAYYGGREAVKNYCTKSGIEFE